MTPSSRRRPGTRELVIAFAIVEAAVLLWLVTRTTRTTRRSDRDARPAAVAPARDTTRTR
jgi:hypothetical protein